MPDPDPVICSESTLDCEGETLVDGLRPGCTSVVGLAGAAAAQCLPPKFSIQFDLSSELDTVARTEAKMRIYEARPAFSELLAIVDHLDLLLDHDGPMLCEGSPGADLGEVHQAQQQALEQQRSALASVVPGGA